MTPIADMVERMLAAGVPADLIVLAIRTTEEAVTRGNARGNAVTAALPPERSRKAVNQERYRAKLKENQGQDVAMAVDVPVTNAVTPGNARGNAVTAALPFTTDLSSLTETALGKEETKKEEPTKVVMEGRKRGTRLPDDWQPSSSDREYAANRGLRLVEIEIEATKFRNYWTNRTDRQAAKPRWDRAWQNWILNVRKGPPNGQSPPNRFREAFDKFKDHVRELERGEEGRGEVVRLLPGR